MRLFFPKIRRARRLRTLRRERDDAELVRFWDEAVADKWAARRREMVGDVSAGRTYIVYHNRDYTKPLAAVVPYHEYTRQAEALRRLDIMEEANRGDPVRNDNARDQ